MWNSDLTLPMCKTWLGDRRGFIVVFFDPARSGYEAAAKHFCPSDLDVSVSGRSFLITGCNSGIGKAAAQEIANRGRSET